jgi:hypothetical protein
MMRREDWIECTEPQAYPPPLCPEEEREEANAMDYVLLTPHEYEALQQAQAEAVCLRRALDQAQAAVRIMEDGLREDAMLLDPRTRAHTRLREMCECASSRAALATERAIDEEAGGEDE